MSFKRPPQIHGALEPPALQRVYSDPQPTLWRINNYPRTALVLSEARPTIEEKKNIENERTSCRFVQTAPQRCTIVLQLFPASWLHDRAYGGAEGEGGGQKKDGGEAKGRERTEGKGRRREGGDNEGLKGGVERERKGREGRLGERQRKAGEGKRGKE